MVRSSYGSWLYKRGAQCQKEQFWVIYLDKNSPVNLIDAELRRLEIGTGYNSFSRYRGSPDSNGLWANKLILYSILAFTGKKCNSSALGVILSVLYLGIFTVTLTAAFRINCRQCKSVFGSPYSKALQKSICVRIKPRASFSLDSLSINFDFFALFMRPPIAFFFTAATLYLRVKFLSKTTPRFFSFVERFYQFYPALKSKENRCFSIERGLPATIMLIYSFFNFSFLLNIHVCTASRTLLNFEIHWSLLSNWKYICVLSA